MASAMTVRKWVDWICLAGAMAAGPAQGGVDTPGPAASAPPASTQAVVTETILRLPAQVRDAYGKGIEHDIVVTVFSPAPVGDAAAPVAPRPLAILLHGRAPQASQRASFGRATYRTTAHWLVTQGFIVGVPTRIGYGVTGGDDVEETGGCETKNYPPGYQAAADQALVALRALQLRPDADREHAVVIGQSYGGATAIALAAMNPPGVVAAINFAGGGGGNPETRPGRPCAPQRLERMFARYGETARMPTLWIYTENDLYMGPDYPREWHQAFARAGGTGAFVQLPPFGKDGHTLFSQGPEIWRPLVLRFLQQQGLVPAAH